MKTFRQCLFVAVALCAAAISTAFAAPLKPPAHCNKVDGDKDGWPAVVDDTVPECKAAAASIKLDCADGDPLVNPAAVEKLADGIDNDCDGSDLKGEPWYKNFDCTIASCVKVLEAEVKACEAAGADKCVVNKSQGKFATSFANYFVDTDCNGIREVLDQAKMDIHEAEVRKGKTCRSASAPRASCTGNCSKASSGTSKPAAPKSDARVDELTGKVTKLAEDATATSKRLDDVDTVLADTGTRLDTLEPVVKDHGERIGKLEARADGHDTDLKAMSQRINEVDETAQTAGHNARAAFNNANVALARGVNAGVDVGYLGKSQQSVAFKGKILRGSSLNGVVIKGHVGAELESLLLRGVGSIGIGGEEGPNSTEQALLFQGGGEALVKLNGNHAVGGGAGYLSHISGGKVSGANAESRGGYVSAVYEFSPGDTGAGRFSLRLEPTLVYEAIGTRGKSGSKDFRADGSSLAGMLVVTFGGGVGSNLR